MACSRNARRLFTSGIFRDVTSTSLEIARKDSSRPVWAKARDDHGRSAALHALDDAASVAPVAHVVAGPETAALVVGRRLLVAFDDARPGCEHLARRRAVRAVR